MRDSIVTPMMFAIGTTCVGTVIVQVAPRAEACVERMQEVIIQPQELPQEFQWLFVGDSHFDSPVTGIEALVEQLILRGWQSYTTKGRRLTSHYVCRVYGSDEAYVVPCTKRPRKGDKRPFEEIFLEDGLLPATTLRTCLQRDSVLKRRGTEKVYRETLGDVCNLGRSLASIEIGATVLA